MKIRRTYIKFSALLIMAITAIIISAAFFLPQLVDINSYKSEIIASLERQLHRKVSFKSGQFSMRYGLPSFVFNSVKISQNNEEAGDLFSAEHITIRLALLPLLQKELSISTLTVSGGELYLHRYSDKRTNIDDLLKQSTGGQKLSLSKIRFRSTTVYWQDDAISKPGFKGSLQVASLNLNDLKRGGKGEIDLSAEIPALNGVATKLKIKGAIPLPRGAAPLSETDIKLNLDLENAEINRYWIYFNRFVPFAPIGGRLNLSTTFIGKISDFSAKGGLGLSGSSLLWRKVFHSPVNPKKLVLNYDLKWKKDSINIKNIIFSADGLKVKGGVQILDIGTKDPRIVASASTEPFRLEDFHRFIPYGIIADDAANYIEQHVTGGLFTLESGTLNGRISQILSMEKGTNYNILHIKGKVEKGVITYGAKTPQFHSIKGSLELLGKDFILKGMSGYFGTSPLTMEGKITDYPLNTQSKYPFTMEMTPKTAEVDWLARFIHGEKLLFSGDSKLHLKGDGYTSAFHLQGVWELKQAAYSYPDLVKKPIGMNNTLQFSAILGATETKITALHYLLPPLNLNATGLFRYGGEPYLAYELKTNSFAMGSNLPIATIWQKYNPRGIMQADVTSSGNPEDFSAMDYRGTLKFNGFSITPSPEYKNINGINGTVTFKGNSLETSSISARYGDSNIHVKGVVKSIHTGESELTLSSPELLLRDFGFGAENSTAAIKRLHTTVSHLDKSTTVKDLSGVFKQSNFHINGTYLDGMTPKADVTINSSFLSIDNLKELINAFEKKNIEKTLYSKQTLGSKSADIAIILNAEKGVYGDLQFSKLKSQLQRSTGIYYLRQTGVGLYGGTLSAKGRIDTHGEGTRYDLTFEGKKINGEKIFQDLKISREVKGLLSFSGNLTARGGTFLEIKKSALGNIRLQLEDGSLKRFNLLSKLFSILNVSQLLKFQLPDMASNGMPYNHINGSFAISDGIATTSDLKIASDAINISLVGKADLVKENLGFTIGVQPLQTVDKIVNHIPIVGWVLTGKDKDFVTLYFEATGPWSDPKVSAIPVKSMSKGVLNIFRRVFELPVRIFTDTGEVLLGQ